MSVQEMQEIWARFLNLEAPLEEVATTHSSILAWKAPWAEMPGGLQCTRSQRAGHDLGTESEQNVYYDMYAC